MPENKNVTRKDYERIGKAFVSTLFVEGHIDHKEVYKVNFIRGLVFGAGSVIGTTLLIAIVLWLLSLFDQLPIVGDVIDTVRATIEETRR